MEGTLENTPDDDAENRTSKVAKNVASSSAVPPPSERLAILPPGRFTIKWEFETNMGPGWDENHVDTYIVVYSGDLMFEPKELCEYSERSSAHNADGETKEEGTRKVGFNQMHKNQQVKHCE